MIEIDGLTRWYGDKMTGQDSPLIRGHKSRYVCSPQIRGAQRVHTGPRALQLTALTVTRPTPSPSTPSKGGACCATGSSSSTTRASSCPAGARFHRTARPTSDGPWRRESASWVPDMPGRTLSRGLDDLRCTECSLPPGGAQNWYIWPLAPRLIRRLGTVRSRRSEIVRAKDKVSVLSGA